MGPLSGVHLLSLSAAVSYGISDVCGAVAARRLAAVWVTFWLQATGFLVLLPIALLYDDVLSFVAIVAGGVAGVAGAVGLLAYLNAMAVSPIGLVSPLAAAVSVAVPVLVGVFVLGEQLSVPQQAGMVCGVAAVILVAYRTGDGARQMTPRALWLSVLAGVGFGLFYVALNAAPTDSGVWPVVAGRISATVLIVAVIVRLRPDRTATTPWALLAAAGVLDAAAQSLFLAATRSGTLGVSVLLTSLFPVVTVIAGRYLLHERMRATQGVAVVLALAAIALIVTG